MYDFKTVSSVNNRYIYFNDGTREVVEVKLLHEIIKDINIELNHYLFMYSKMIEVYDQLTVRIELSEYHDNLKHCKESIHDLSMCQSSVFSAYDYNYVAKLRKLLNQCKVFIIKQ